MENEVHNFTSVMLQKINVCAGSMMIAPIPVALCLNAMNAKDLFIVTVRKMDSREV